MYLTPPKSTDLQSRIFLRKTNIIFNLCSVRPNFLYGRSPSLIFLSSSSFIFFPFHPFSFFDGFIPFSCCSHVCSAFSTCLSFFLLFSSTFPILSVFFPVAPSSSPFSSFFLLLLFHPFLDYFYFQNHCAFFELSFLYLGFSSSCFCFCPFSHHFVFFLFLCFCQIPSFFLILSFWFQRGCDQNVEGVVGTPGMVVSSSKPSGILWNVIFVVPFHNFKTAICWSFPAAFNLCSIAFTFQFQFNSKNNNPDYKDGLLSVDNVKDKR